MNNYRTKFQSSELQETINAEHTNLNFSIPVKLHVENQSGIRNWTNGKLTQPKNSSVVFFQSEETGLLKFESLGELAAKHGLFIDNVKN